MSSPDRSADSLASTRSRRGPTKARCGREAALAKLKASKQGNWSYEVSDTVEDAVYDIVDEKSYAERIKNRLEEDFIVDDDEGGYADDGREIFDDEDDEDSGDKDRKGKYRGPKAGKRKSEAKDDQAAKKKRGNIKNMFLNMQSAAKKDEKKEADLDGDDVLESLLGEMKSKKSSRETNKSVKAANPFLVKTSSRVLRPQQAQQQVRAQAREKSLSPAKSKRSCLDDIDDIENTAESQIIDEASQAEMEKPENNQSMEYDLDDYVIDDDDDFTDPTATKVTEKEPTAPSKPLPVVESQASLKTEAVKRPAAAPQAVNSVFLSMTTDSNVEPAVNGADAKLDAAVGEMAKKVFKDGSDTLKMYWLDAYEDPYKHPGTVWLFGKMYVSEAKAYVSCCVTVKEIPRRVFLVKREHKFDSKLKKEVEDTEVSVKDVYQEFSEKMADRYKIGQFRSKPDLKMKYAFEHVDVPSTVDVLEVQYEPKYPALPSDLSGETFSRVFGTNQSSLEYFLVSRKIKGPCWLEISEATPSSPPLSWCKVEAVCADLDNVSVITTAADGSVLSVPPLTVLAFNMKTIINPKTMLNEVAAFSGLVHQEFYLDKAAPKPNFQSYFCALTRPSDEIWPFDFQKVLQSQTRGPRIDKMDSERALLGFITAKIGKLDPDIIVGYDITGFDLDVLLHRIVINKIPHWSRLGRLRRSQPPVFKGRMAERMAATGRLVCDLKISAKELIRCKSYDLPALVERILSRPDTGAEPLGCDAMRKAYESSQSLLRAAAASLQEAADTLQCVADLNALPLALQITTVAGNVMSRTLMGGRAERNEFLLLHAFSEKNYIVPDKQYGKHKRKGDDHDDHDQSALDESSAANTTAKGKRKPAYAGGLVLEPKKGFYDKCILLMDFNSLYPSIIQEYNICFTTVNRKRPKGVATDDYIPDLPSVDAQPGVLPTEIKKLVDSRRHVKNLLKNPKLNNDQRMQYDIRQQALKLTANSIFFAKPLAALITSRGREILLQTKSLVERMNLEVIYGDTDSIMVNSNSVDFDEVVSLGGKIKQEVNKMFKLLELDLDGIFRYMLLLKKKKYAAVTASKRPGSDALVLTTELKGLDIVRRDWSQLASDVGKKILEKILSDCSADERILFIHETLEALANDLRAGAVSLSDLAITKQLTKNPADYADKKALPHVQVAERLNRESKSGKKLKAGDTVQYVICDDGTSNPATQRAFALEEVRDRDLKVDVQYYLSQQLHPVVSRLCDPLEGTDSARIASSLGLDPEQYRSRASARDQDAAAEEREAAAKDEDRFRQCEKLKVNCSCGEEIVLDGAVRGMSDTDRVLALARCPRPGCDLRPIERRAHVANRLTLAVRRHVARFYAGHVICEDPACNGRTRQLPGDFVGAFPTCPFCKKAVMTKEYTDRELYTQLLSYQQLFDIPKANARYSGSGLNLSVELAKIKSGMDNYALLKQQMDRFMDQNNYSIVDLGKLFGGVCGFKAHNVRGKNL